MTSDTLDFKSMTNKNYIKKIIKPILLMIFQNLNVYIHNESISHKKN